MNSLLLGELMFDIKPIGIAQSNNSSSSSSISKKDNLCCLHKGMGRAGAPWKIESFIFPTFIKNDGHRKI